MKTKKWRLTYALLICYAKIKKIRKSGIKIGVETSLINKQNKNKLKLIYMQFNEQYIHRKPPKSNYKLNPDSDRYRICKYCDAEFMTSHRSREFCDNNNICSNEFHNALKRYKRDMKILNDEIEKQPQLDSSGKITEVTNQNIGEETIETTVEETINETDESILRSNISILENLNIHQKGSYYSVESLNSYGFKFTHHSGRGELFNIDSKHNCHFIQVGNFRLYRVSYSTLLIINLIFTLC